MVYKTDASEVHAVFDTYERSIKDVEHETRGESDCNRVVTIGRAQTPPKDFKASLKSKAYKTVLIKFLIQEWKDDKYAEMMQCKRVIATHAKIVQSYRSMGGTIHSSEVPMYCCGHTGDTRIVYHLCQIESDSNVVMKDKRY